jgi:multimeric flavodoxin WrbA
LKKKLLAFSSSPRRDGNSETLLKEFCRAADDARWEIEMIRINNLHFKPCQACDLCARDGRCVLKDDMQEIYPKLASSDALVIATPVTFGSVNAQLKMFIDRFQCWWNAKYTLKKPFIPDEVKHPGFFICVGALKKKDYCENAEQIIKVFFHNINHTLIDSMAFRGYDEKGAIAEDLEALKKIYRSGQNFFSQIDKN